jgi:hypothetical protein
MATRVEKQTVDGTSVVVGYGVVNIASYSAPVPPATQGNTTYTTQDVVVDVEIDYTTYLSRIATALETIATQTTTIATQTTTIATQTTTIATQTTMLATKLTEIETHQQRLRELGEGEGIRIISPYELFGFVTIYRNLIEEGNILKWRDVQPTDKDVAKSLNDLGKYIEKIRVNVPRSF